MDALARGAMPSDLEKWSQHYKRSSELKQRWNFFNWLVMLNCLFHDSVSTDVHTFTGNDWSENWSLPSSAQSSLYISSFWALPLAGPPEWRLESQPIIWTTISPDQIIIITIFRNKMLYLVWSIINRRRDNFRIKSSGQVLINKNQNDMNENLTCLDSHMNTNLPLNLLFRSS